MMALILVSALIAGCGPGEQPRERKGVITMGPHVTETVFALGQGARIVAVGSFDDYPPEAATLPKAGGYINPDFEKIAMLNPELIIHAGKSQGISDFAALKGFRTLSVHMDSLASIDAGIAEIGDALGARAEADALRAKIRGELDAVRDAVAGEPRRRVLLITMRQEHSLNTLYTTNGGTFLSEITALAGGDNVFAGESATYFEASKERVVMAAPQVIIEFHAGESLDDEEQARFVADWRQLPSLPAVQHDRVYVMTQSHAMRPGPRVGEIARHIARLLNPKLPLSN